VARLTRQTGQRFEFTACGARQAGETGRMVSMRMPSSNIHVQRFDWGSDATGAGGLQR
jgi:hypothetical protein